MNQFFILLFLLAPHECPPPEQVRPPYPGEQGGAVQLEGAGGGGAGPGGVAPADPALHSPPDEGGRTQGGVAVFPGSFCFAPARNGKPHSHFH